MRTMRGLGRPTGEPPENLLRFAETRKPEPLVPIERTYGVAERIDSDGDVVVALDEAAVAAAADALVAAGVDTIAIAFLWSVRNDAHERRAREIVAERAPGVFVTISSEISKAVGEYERFVATLINSYVGPVTSTYLHGVQDRLADVGFAGELHIMQCHGGMVPLGLGADRPIFTIGSGPVGGLIGCARVADDLGRRDIIASDMGGTSLRRRDHQGRRAARRRRHPARQVALPRARGRGDLDRRRRRLDRLDRRARRRPPGRPAERLLAAPAPPATTAAATEPTVTDADLMLGYIAPEATFGSKGERGGFKPRRDLAEKAIQEKVADPLGLSLTDAALGIVEVANAKMANALENEIIGRGFDPRDFVLMSYGGAGPFHAAGYAASLGVDTIVVPGEAASVWSAFGISQADIRYQYEASVVLIEPFDLGARRAAPSSELEAQARAALSEREDVERLRVPPLRPHALPVAAPRARDALPRRRRSTPPTLEEVKREFVEHLHRTLRRGRAAARRARWRSSRSGSSRRSRWAPRTSTGSRSPSGEEFAKGTRPVYFERGAGAVEAAVYNGDAMPLGEVVEGPAVIDLAITGIVVPPGHQLRAPQDRRLRDDPRPRRA